MSAKTIKNRKILKSCAISAIAVLVLAVSLLSIFAQKYEGTVKGLNNKITTLADCVDVGGRVAVLKDARQYSETVDPESDGFTEAMATLTSHEIACAKEIVTNLGTMTGAASASYYIRLMRSFLATCPYPDTEADAADFALAVADAETRYAAFMEANAKALAANVKISDYDLPLVSKYTFENGTEGFSQVNASATNTVKAPKDASGNGYLEVTYGSDVHTWTGKGYTIDENNLVIEFDVTTFTQLPAARILFEHGSTTNSSTGASVFGVFFVIRPDGKLGDTDTANTPWSDTPIIVPGEWTHITMVVDYDDASIDVYVDGELLIENKLTCTTPGVTYKFSFLRAGANKSPGSFAMDNVIAYKGSAPRDLDYLKNMDDEQAFIYYASVVADESEEAKERGTAYKLAQKLIDKFYFDGSFLPDVSDEVKTAVEQVNAFDYNKVMEGYFKANWNTLKAKCDALFAIKADPTTLENRRNALADIDKFITACNGDIYTLDLDYSVYTYNLEAVRVRIADEDAVNQFISYMDAFAASSDAQNYNKNYSLAKEMIDAGLKIEIRNETGYDDFLAAYEAYLAAPAVIYRQECQENSFTFVKCVEALDKIGVDNIDENYDKVEMYVVYLRKILRDGAYDPAYIGMEIALQIFQPYNEYIFANIQAGHIEYVTAKLEEFQSVVSYVEKLGISASLDRYLAANDIDFDDPVMKALADECEAIKAELSSQKEEYEGILRQNTVYFINMTAMIPLLSDYTELKQIYEDASAYYYAMNVDSAEAQEAIAVYQELESYLEKVEDDSMRFVMNVTLFSLDTYHPSMLYATLVKCAASLEYAEASINGVADALAVYEAKYAEYMGNAAAANAEVAATVDAVMAQRADYLPGDLSDYVTEVLDA